jgi:hypothetical protein
MLKEKEFFTSRRLENLSAYPRLTELEKYGNYCLIPLDIPKFEFPDLVDWFFKNSKPTYKIQPDVANNLYGMTSFNAVDVMPTNEMAQQDIWTLNVKQEFMTDFQYVYDSLISHLPFHEISRIRMWSSTTSIPFHRDHTKFVDFPGAFRIMLYDENPKQTLSLIQSLPDTPDNLSKKFPIPRLQDTNSYVWNNLRTKHGSEFIPGFRKIIIILDRYELDIDKYQILIDRSIEKYRTNCFISETNKII